MKIATWNINSISVRLQHVLEWIKTNRPDALCLQEIKCIDAKFPAAAFEEIGYHTESFGQPTYNGVAILSLRAASTVTRGFPEDGDEAQKRLIAATINGVRIVNVYIPNGSEVGSEKYAYKLAWMENLRTFFDESCDPNQPLVLCGDFNVAVDDRDVHDPKLWEGKILCSDAERAALENIHEWGLIDTFRLHNGEAGHFTWWDYRGGAYPRNQGLRIDHLWASKPLADKCNAAWIDKVPRTLEKPSDHAPVIANFKL